MKIGTIGTGNMGRALGVALARMGHQVKFGSREPAKAQALADQAGGAASGGSYADAARFGDVVILATPWAGTRAAIEQAGTLGGKVLLDVTNPLAPDFGSLVVGHTTSGGEEVAKWAAGAKVVKAFNAVASMTIDAAPNFAYPETPSIFYAGDDERAKKTVAQLIAELGFDPVDTGPLRSARYLEAMAMLWVFMAYGMQRGTDSAFRLMRK